MDALAPNIHKLLQDRSFRVPKKGALKFSDLLLSDSQLILSKQLVRGTSHGALVVDQAMDMSARLYEYRVRQRWSQGLQLIYILWVPAW